MSHVKAQSHLTGNIPLFFAKKREQIVEFFRPHEDRIFNADFDLSRGRRFHNGAQRLGEALHTLRPVEVDVHELRANVVGKLDAAEDILPTLWCGDVRLAPGVDAVGDVLLFARLTNLSPVVLVRVFLTPAPAVPLVVEPFEGVKTVFHGKTIGIRGITCTERRLVPDSQKRPGHRLCPPAAEAHHSPPSV